MTKVSVILPVYNVENYLEECLDSIINQTLEDIEIICINDGSTDKSLDILKEYANKDNRISLISQENKGVGATRNVGLELAKGKYIYFIDSDDILELNALNECYKKCEEESLDFLIFQLVNYNDIKGEYYNTPDYSMNEIADLVKDNVFNYKDLDELIFKITVTAYSKFYNRNFIKTINAKFSEGLIFEDNVFFWHVLFSAERIGFLKKQLYIRRRHDSSITTSYDERFINTIKINNLIIQKFIEFNQFNKFKNILYNKKISLINFRLSEIDDEFKELFYNEMRKDFSKIITNERYDEFLSCLNDSNEDIFKSVIFSKNYEEFSKNKEIEELMKKYKTGRIDIKNFGKGYNTVEVLDSTYESKIDFPDWFKDDNGNGLVVEGNKGKIDLKIKCIKNGTLNITLRGADVRDIEKNRFPVYIEYTSFKINNKEHLQENKLICHDEPLRIIRKVKDNELITIHVEWQPFTSSSLYEIKK